MADDTTSLLGVDALKGLQGFSFVLGAAGLLQSAIGSYYTAQSQRYQLRSQAMDLEFRGSISELNARAAEQDAQALLQAGREEKARTTLQFGALKSTSRAQQAAAGVQAGVGSAAEVQASIEAVKEIDALTIERNAVRAAGASRLRAVDLRNQARLARVSAANVRRTGGALSPGLSAITSLVGGAGQVASQWLYSSLLR